MTLIENHERTHANRPAVLDAVEGLRGPEPWVGYDNMDVDEITECLDQVPSGVARQVPDYEQRHLQRKRVISVAETCIPETPAAVPLCGPRGRLPQSSLGTLPDHDRRATGTVEGRPQGGSPCSGLAGLKYGARGHRRLLEWVRALGTSHRFGAEGTDAYGAGLTRYLRRQGMDVVEVIRPIRQTRRRADGKNDAIDAEAAGRPRRPHR